MEAPAVPFVAVLDDCNVRYSGRAEATQSGGTLTVVAKSGGAVVAHGLDSNVSPQFYNPDGNVRTWTRLDRLYIWSTSESDEVLKMNGVPRFVHEIEEPTIEERPPRTQVRGREEDLVDWLMVNLDRIGMEGRKPIKEKDTTGGRVDLFFREGTVVEVKQRASVYAYDQAQRYLRDPKVSQILIVCIEASSRLSHVVDDDDRVSLLTLEI